MTINYDKLKNNMVVFYNEDGEKVEMFTVEDFVKYLHQTPQILDKTEKRYIRNVIAPFWRKVEYIKKVIDNYGRYYIAIMYKEDGTTQHICFPAFDTNSEMYSNMRPRREYTLEELDIKFE